MDVTPLVKHGTQIIQSYQADGFRVSGEVYGGTVLVSSEETKLWDIAPEKTTETLVLSDFTQLFDEAETIDVVLLGCGTNMNFLNPALRNDLKAKGLHIETMDTGAACRTYNVLMAEGRRVVAALLLP